MTSVPTVVICPGGAYCHLSERESGPVAAAFEKMGARAEILTYSIRTGEEQDFLGLTPVRQLSAKVGEIRKSTDGSVIVCGFSTGGHLAATLGVHWKTLGLARPDAMILCYPVITANPAWINEPSFYNLTGQKDREFFSLEKHVSADTPPAFLWHTASDGEVPVENTLSFASAMSREKIPFEMHIYPFGEHGLSLATEEVEQPEKGRLPDAHIAGWIDECEAWLYTMHLL